MSFRKTPFRCSDRMCGGADCETCFPDYFPRGDETEDETEDEHDDPRLDHEPDVTL